MVQDVRSDIAGSVWQILAPAGARVRSGEDVIVLESMKMEVPVTAPCDGVVTEVLVGEGTPVGEDEVLLRVEPD